MKYWIIAAVLAILIVGAFVFTRESERNNQGIGQTASSTDAVEVTSDITYATIDGIILKLDLYQPKAVTAALPIIVFAHGGGFHGGDKAEKSAVTIATALAGHGYAVASINYRLSDQATFPAPIQDEFGAIRYLRAHADTYHLDKTNVALMGGSAGSILSTMTGVLADEPGLAGSVGGNIGESNSVQAVVPISGELYSADLGAFKTPQAEAGLQAFGCTSFTAPNCEQKLKLYLPEYHLDANDPPFLIIQGGIDTTVPPQNAIDLTKAMKAAGIVVTLLTNPTEPHGLQNGIDRLPEIFAFLDKAFSR